MTREPCHKGPVILITIIATMFNGNGNSSGDSQGECAKGGGRGGGGDWRREDVGVGEGSREGRGKE